MSVQASGLLGLLILVADIYALYNIIVSVASPGEKIFWALLVILLPVIGLLFWFFLGPRGRQIAA